MKKLIFLLLIVPFFGARTVPPKPIKPNSLYIKTINVKSLNVSVKKLEASTSKLNEVLK